MIRRLLGPAVALGLLLPTAPALAAGHATSSNWAGYAVSHSGVKFHKVSGSWVQPKADCATTPDAFAAAWVGIGGYHTTSKALEQIGTEVDCQSGHQRSSAWYELVPAASVNIPLTVHAGDRLNASVAVTGYTVRLALENVTRGTSYVKTLHAPSVDVTSAEWIMEAPSLCTGSSSCRTMPLADFANAQFSSARATSTSGHTGTISDPAWAKTTIDLVPGAQGLPGGPGFGGPGVARRVAGSGSAITGTLNATGGGFSVAYAGGGDTTTPAPATPAPTIPAPTTPAPATPAPTTPAPAPTTP